MLFSVGATGAMRAWTCRSVQEDCLHITLGTLAGELCVLNIVVGDDHDAREHHQEHGKGRYARPKFQFSVAHCR